MKEIFFKKQKKFHEFSQQDQGSEEQRTDPDKKGGQKPGENPPRGPESQEIQCCPQGQDQGHEQAQAAVAHGDPQEKEQERRQKAEAHVQDKGEPLQPETAAEGGHHVVHQAESGAAGQGNEGLQPLISGVELHQPSSFPKKPRRPEVFSA